MKVAVLVTARLGSTRLPRKHLLVAAGKPMLQHLVDAIDREFVREVADGSAVVVIATSERPENLEFGEAIHGCTVFAGSDGNVPLRHLQAAEALGADAILSVDGDDILCSPRAMRAVFERLRAGALLVKTEGLPLGMNAWGYGTALLRTALERFRNDDLLETGWGRVFEGVVSEVERLDCAAPDRLRFTLDYEEDYRFFSALLAEERVAAGMASEAEIVALVLSRGLDRITQPVVDEYWRNFHKHVEEEEHSRRKR